ncbi:MAG: M2 family metallopeptidase [candidate division KSB1 bacterium]|nr:M2 family metallopeptidase [candidate division KSB1 bacterium]MDZ7408338.1 M2 family metallopeptidase [candidate division KSB1 bacterium]
MRPHLWMAGGLLLLAACTPSPQALQSQAQAFLDGYTAKFKELSYAAALAEWASNTKIVEGDTTNAHNTRKANEALAAFTGSVDNIEKARRFLQERDKLTPLQVKQLQIILYKAADKPQTVADIVKARIAAETAQTEKLYGFSFQIAGKPVTTNEIDNILKTATDLQQRRAAWEASKEVGRQLKDGLARLQRLRNQTVQALGYSDYFSYQVSDYGMTVDEMMALMDELVRELRPLYRELHTYARYELARRYQTSVPEKLPAHWLPNRWAQDWSAMINLAGFDLDAALKDKSAEWIVQQAEDFYVSLGFDKMPASFWEKSSLYPLPADAPYKKNNHASAWHLDLEHDIRALMSIEPNAEWYETTHHELGHIYYFLSYTNDQVPPLLREGANRACHEALGSLMGLASMQRPFLQSRGLLPAQAQSDDMQALLKEALNFVVFIPFSAGTMSHFEYELYAGNLPQEEYNRRWWELVEKYQGVVPPGPRGEDYCDAATKTHINDDAAQYYDYALSFILLYQLHDHIATKILGQDPHATNYYGNREVGKFLADIMRPGASRDWREMLREKTGEDLSAQAMLRYFAPLRDYLEKENAGRKHTLPDI